MGKQHVERGIHDIIQGLGIFVMSINGLEFKFVR